METRTDVQGLTTLTLQRNVQFLYEEQIARFELTALGCDCIARNDEDWRLFSAHVNGNARLINERAAYTGAIDGQHTVYAQLIQPNYQGGRFNRTRSVNQYLTHWIYPYRGKFHPQMVRGLLNILGVSRGSTVCEPYLGSGTTAVEASLLGANTIGVDISPLCVLLTKVKTQAWTAVDAIRECVRRIVTESPLTLASLRPRRSTEPLVSDFLEVAKLVTASDVARRSREEEPALRRNLAAMLESVEAYANAVKEFRINPGPVDARLGDCRDLAAASIRTGSIDAVVTSPPYSIALDYVKNDDHALKALGVDIKALRSRMTGVRGRGGKEKLALYNEDMRLMFGEVSRVLKRGGAAAFVIGDATVDGCEVTTTATMAEWARGTGLRLERSIPKIVFGLYNVMQDERILVFRKP
jgi:tRNA G10  N-methylase Trm11